MKKSLIVANWKMNHSIDDSLKFLTQYQNESILSEDVEVVICPPFTSLYSMSVILSEKETPKLGAQNCHFETEGAFTGEISPLFLKDLQCSYVLIGHSERRHIFSEKDKDLALKVSAVLQSEMKAIFCIGETLEQREAQQTFDIIKTQLDQGLGHLSVEEIKECTIAYEPVWAIGTGKTASPDQAEEVHESIDNWIKRNYGDEAADQIRLLYGGSVKPENCAELLKQNHIDGALVGGASLELDSFLKIVNSAA